jgi:hypothetical protein
MNVFYSDYHLAVAPSVKWFWAILYSDHQGKEYV